MEFLLPQDSSGGGNGGRPGFPQGRFFEVCFRSQILEGSKRLPRGVQEASGASQDVPGGFQEAPESVKNRCQEAFYLGFQFQSIFDRFKLPTWTLRSPFGTSEVAFS